MRRGLLAALLILAGCSSDPKELPGIERAVASGPRDFLRQAVVGPQGDGTYVVATTQVISPAGDNVAFRGRPTDLAVHPEGKLLAVKSSFDLVLIDVESRNVRQSLPLPATSEAFPGYGDGTASYCGIVWAPDGKMIWTTDAHDTLHAAALGEDGRLSWTWHVQLPGPRQPADPEGFHRSAPGGLALDAKKDVLYVALSRNNSIGVVDVATGGLRREIPVGMAPYTVHLVGRKAYVSNWGGRRPRTGDVTGPSSGSEVVVDAKTGVVASGTVSVIDLERGSVVGEVEVGLHPSGLASSPDGRFLYVANANGDFVSVIDTRTDSATAAIDVRPMKELPIGSAPNALAFSPDGSRLYVALGGNNALAVVDPRSRRLLGFVPTGWYPGAVATSAKGTILVANIKGVGSRGPDFGIAPHELPRRPAKEDAYNSHDYVGTVSILDPPGKGELDQYTEQVAVNMRLPHMLDAMRKEPSDPRPVPVPTRPGETSVFEHVLYIIKENRTYDQILGDVRKGNGEPDFCLFGEEVTPNQHALAEEFVLFDNFYCNGVLSADGHQWTDEGYTTDYIEKSFGGFPRSYPFDGGDAMAYSPGGFIWDEVLRKGLAFRVYGEFVKASIDPPDAAWSDIYRDYVDGVRRVSIRATTELHTLAPYLSPRFVGFPGTVQDVYRAREFLEELEGFEREGNLPNFMTMLLPNDHTAGTREGYPTPRAMVADNDLALGRIVEAVSKSRFWPRTVIFVVEDDPQNGLDHVDGRRTVALVASPYTRRGFVDSNHYNQNSLLRTIELILGLPPMTQFDLAANPMVDCFTGEIDTTPYTARENRIPLDEMNKPVADLHGLERQYAEESARLPLEDVDLADEDVFNRIIWHSVKGSDVPYPDVERLEEVGGEAWGVESPREREREQGAEKVKRTLRERSVRLRQGFVETAPKPKGRKREPGPPPSAAGLRSEDSARTRRERALTNGPTTQEAVGVGPQGTNAPELSKPIAFALWGTGAGLAGFGLVYANLLLSRRTRSAGPRAHWLVGWILNGVGMVAIGFGWVVLLTLPPHRLVAFLSAIGMVAAFGGALLYVASASRVGRLRRLSKYSLDLETDGVYALVRHPQALALVLIAIGLAGISGSIPFLTTLPLWIVCWWVYARIEERLDLLPAFGAEYEAYRRATPLLIPSFGALSSAFHGRSTSSRPREKRLRRSGTVRRRWRSPLSVDSRGRSRRR